MEQKNENEFLMLKNYNAFLIDLGLNISFSKNDDEIKQQFQLEKNTSSVKKIDDYVKEWQFKNKHYFISRNKNMSSKNILLLFEENNFIKIDQSKNHQPELLDKMFASIGQNIDDFFIINIDLAKMKETHLKKINEIIELYFVTLKPKIIINMCFEDFDKAFEVSKLNLNFECFKIPSISNIMKNQNLKREAWVQLKLLKAMLDEF